MTTSITVRHNFETGHRLPQLGGKCTSLHGHSWWCDVTVTAPSNPDMPTIAEVVVEYGAFKRGLREWIDTNLDHGLMLGKDDPLAAILPDFGKVYVFGTEPETVGLMWPTVEHVAVLVAEVAARVLVGIDRAPGAYVSAVTVHETHVNAATWTADR
jgi:6-pyruvoyltetrahydropterin/6-carboxytetrahydropterin synthase